jgi:small subunit ribosomal protein S16
MVVAEQSKAVKRQYLELVGHYVPTVQPKVLKFDKERIAYWISKGAKPTETVASLLKAEGMADMDKYIHFTTDRKSKKKKGGDEPAPAAAATPAAEPAPEAPAADPASEADAAAKEETPAA